MAWAHSTPPLSPANPHWHCLTLLFTFLHHISHLLLLPLLFLLLLLLLLLLLFLRLPTPLLPLPLLCHHPLPGTLPLPLLVQSCKHLLRRPHLLLRLLCLRPLHVLPASSLLDLLLKSHLLLDTDCRLLGSMPPHSPFVRSVHQHNCSASQVISSVPTSLVAPPVNIFARFPTSVVVAFNRIVASQGWVLLVTSPSRRFPV